LLKSVGLFAGFGVKRQTSPIPHENCQNIHSIPKTRHGLRTRRAKNKKNSKSLQPLGAERVMSFELTSSGRGYSPIPLFSKFSFTLRETDEGHLASSTR
jgi:hypothetical protein